MAPAGGWRAQPQDRERPGHLGRGGAAPCFSSKPWCAAQIFRTPGLIPCVGRSLPQNHIPQSAGIHCLVSVGWEGPSRCPNWWTFWRTGRLQSDLGSAEAAIVAVSLLSPASIPSCPQATLQFPSPLPFLFLPLLSSPLSGAGPLICQDGRQFPGFAACCPCHRRLHYYHPLSKGREGGRKGRRGGRKGDRNLRIGQTRNRPSHPLVDEAGLMPVFPSVWFRIHDTVMFTRL